MKRRDKVWLTISILTPIALFLALLLLAFVAERIPPSGPRKALPKTATEIQEYYSGALNGDCLHLIKARVSEVDYHLYAAHFGVSRHFDSVGHAYYADAINRELNPKPTWWESPRADALTYYSLGESHRYVLRYSSGYLYYMYDRW
jgi:hypothetical protein